MKRSELAFNILLVFIDFLMLIIAGLAAYFLRTSPWLQEWRPAQIFFSYFSFSRYFPMVIATSVFWIIIFGIVGLYRSKISQGLLEEILKIIIACSAGVMAIVIFIFFRRELFNSRFIILAGWFFAIILVSIGRAVMKKIWRKYNFGIQKVILIGTGNITRKIKREIERDPGFRYKVVGELPDFTVYSLKNSFQNIFFDEIILCDPEYPKEKIVTLANFCEENQIDFKFVPDLFQAFFSNIEVEAIGGFPIIELTRTPLEGWGRAVKRLIDIIGSLIGIIMLLPFWAILAVIIKIDSSGPALVKLKRVSQGKEFYLYKFRSMQNNAQALKRELFKYDERNDGPLFKMKDDPRVTRVGRIIRKTWIDELPQLINVLKGEMSLVGPRPHEPEEVAQYQKHHKRTFFVKPGMTGLAQISGGAALEFEEEVKLDTYYIKNWSLLFDLKILLKTLLFLFKDKSGY